jgi:hypothetical protein
MDTRGRLYGKNPGDTGFAIHTAANVALMMNKEFY